MLTVFLTTVVRVQNKVGVYFVTREAELVSSYFHFNHYYNGYFCIYWRAICYLAGDEGDFGRLGSFVPVFVYGCEEGSNPGGLLVPSPKQQVYMHQSVLRAIFKSKIWRAIIPVQVDNKSVERSIIVNRGFEEWFLSICVLHRQLLYAKLSTDFEFIIMFM